MTTHEVTVVTGQADVVRIGDRAAGEHTVWQREVTIHQARCSCGWQGPRRTSAWEAGESPNGDARRHREDPYAQ